MSRCLELSGLRRTFSGAAAPTLDGVDLTVPLGGCVAILGPSGSGKSTVLRLVAGLDGPDGGRITLGGRDLTAVPTEQRRTALVFQRPRLFPHLDVRDNVAFPLMLAGEPRRSARRQADRFLDLVGADDVATRRPRSLSGGQEQRVALARALAARPDVLLLDEPFSGLDPAVRSQMHQLLQELRAAVEPTIVLVTHDRDEAATVADSVALLLDGRIAQHDLPQRLYLRPASLAVSRFLGGANEVAGVVEGRWHHSALGALHLPDEPGLPAGAAVLLVRQEAVRLTAATDRDADAVGVVSAVSAHGPRTLVQVSTDAGPLHAEAPPGSSWRGGDLVGVVLPVQHRWVVRDDGVGSHHDASRAAAEGLRDG